MPAKPDLGHRVERVDRDILERATQRAAITAAFSCVRFSKNHEFRLMKGIQGHFTKSTDPKIILFLHC